MVIMDDDSIGDEDELEAGFAEEATEDDIDLEGVPVEDLPY